jgi:hypothetical protein
LVADFGELGDGHFGSVSLFNAREFVPIVVGWALMGLTTVASLREQCGSGSSTKRPLPARMSPSCQIEFSSLRQRLFNPKKNLSQ